MTLFDTAGAACTTGKDVENHIEIYKLAHDNPASSIIICNSSCRLDKVTQDEIKFCLAMYGPLCFRKMIYVVTKTRINKSQLARWNREQGPNREEITLQTKRQELESAISKFAKTLPGVNYEVNVPVVYVDAFALDEEEK